MSDPVRNTLSAMGLMTVFTAITGLKLDDVIDVQDDPQEKNRLLAKVGQYIEKEIKSDPGSQVTR